MNVEDLYSRSEMVAEVAKHAVWREIGGDQVVVLVHCFHDEENKRLSVLYEIPNVEVKDDDYREFQKKYTKV